MAAGSEGEDRRLHAAATQRNREPILEVLRRVLASDARVLEIASGTGQHAAYFAGQMPGLRWQPSDVEGDLLASIAAWSAAEGATNVAPPIRLDVTADPWPVDAAFDAVFSANMIHIAPWACCVGLVRGAARCLKPGGLLVLYGPFRIGGEHTAPSNEAFDADLRRRHPSWGVRDLEAVADLARSHGLVLEQRFEMPANNQVLVLRKRETDAGRDC